MERDVRWLKDCGHLIHLSKPQEFVSLVRGFLRNEI